MTYPGPTKSPGAGSHDGFKPAEFSANRYLDVYNGHMQTFNHISANRNHAFHTTMADIFRLW